MKTLKDKENKRELNKYGIDYSFFWSEDVKEAVLKFKNRLLELDPNGIEDFNSYDIIRIHNLIFGDWEE